MSTTTQQKTHEMEIEVEITDRDVHRHLMSRAMERLGIADTAGAPPMTIGPHVCCIGESRWHWGTDEQAALFIRAAYRIRGFGDPEQEISGWGIPDGNGQLLERYDDRETAVRNARASDHDLDVVALDPNGDPIIR